MFCPLRKSFCRDSTEHSDTVLLAPSVCSGIPFAAVNEDNAKHLGRFEAVLSHVTFLGRFHFRTCTGQAAANRSEPALVAHLIHLWSRQASQPKLEARPRVRPGWEKSSSEAEDEQPAWTVGAWHNTTPSYDPTHAGISPRRCTQRRPPSSPPRRFRRGHMKLCAIVLCLRRSLKRLGPKCVSWICRTRIWWCLGCGVPGHCVQPIADGHPFAHLPIFGGLGTGALCSCRCCSHLSEECRTRERNGELAGAGLCCPFSGGHATWKRRPRWAPGAWSTRCPGSCG